MGGSADADGVRQGDVADGIADERSIRKIDKSQLQARLDTYLVERILNLHNILVGVALGVAGLAAANLLDVHRNHQDYRVTLWLLWFAGLLAVVTAYAGAVIGSVLLPSRIPGIVDLLVPLGLGILEFLLFGILAHKVTGLSSPTSVMAAWFFAFTGFCMAAVLAIWRASHLIDPGAFSPDLARTVLGYLAGIRADMISATVMAAISLAAAIVNLTVRHPVIQDRILASVIVAGLVGALVAHQLAARSLREAMQPRRKQA
jgi:hypothetical protein